MHGTPRADRTPPGFVGGTLDRVDHVRTNPVLLGQAFADPAARRLVLDRLEPVEADGHLLLEPIDRQALLADHVLLGVAIAGAAVLTYAWVTLVALCLAYIATIIWCLATKRPPKRGPGTEQEK